MKKILLTIFIIFAAAVPLRACDASRTNIFPGVSWCNGCCEREGYSWLEVNDRQYLLHKDNTHIAGGPVLFLGFVVVVGAVVMKRKKNSRSEDSM